MLTLYQYFPDVQNPDPSPFCVKADFYLKLTGQSYQVKTGNPLKSPRKKLPFIQDDQATVCDSHEIMIYLTNKYGYDLDLELDQEQKAAAYAISRTFDEYGYFLLLRSRWMDDRIWPHLKSRFFQPLPAPLRLFVPNLARKQMRKMLWLQGTGRYDEAEFLRRQAEFCQHISQLLGDRRYFFGEKLSSLDVTAFAHLFHITLFPIQASFHQAAAEYPNLEAYVKRIADQYYPQMNMSFWQ